MENLSDFKNLVPEISYSRLKHGLERVFRECLGYQNENILLITDRGFQGRQIAGILGCAVADSFESSIVVIEPLQPGEPTNSQVIKSLKNMKSGIVALALSNKLGSMGSSIKSFRGFVRERGLRFISTPGLASLRNDQLDNLSQSLDVDYAQLAVTGEAIRSKLSDAGEVALISRNGTNLKFSITGREPIINVGTYREPGSGGNIPTGEVYLAPVETKTEGAFFIDIMRTSEGTETVDGSVRLEVKKGSIVDVEGKNSQKLMRDIIRTSGKLGPRTAKNCFRVGELAMGINPNAPRSGVMIIDEKRFGTAHVAIGSNYWFGGKLRCPLHLDQLVENAEIYLDGERLKI